MFPYGGLYQQLSPASTRLMRREPPEKLGDDNGGSPAIATAYVVATIGGVLVLLAAIWLVWFTEQRKERRGKGSEEDGQDSPPVTERAQLHAICLTHPGPHEMENKPLPFEAENMGSEKVELPAILPGELQGDTTHRPTGSMNLSFSSEETMVDEGMERDFALKMIRLPEQKVALTCS